MWSPLRPVGVAIYKLRHLCTIETDLDEVLDGPANFTRAVNAIRDADLTLEAEPSGPRW